MTLYVQIKKHDGETDAEAVRQVIAMLVSHPDADGCVMSSANGYTEEACELAENHGVALLDGNDICRLLMRMLPDYFD